MTKRVVNSGQVLHLWAHQAQDSARNGTGSVFFDGATCYSYGRHFPMATIHKRGGNTLVLATTATYSVTTAKHLGWMRRAVSHLPSVAVPDVNPAGLAAHKANLADIGKRIAAQLGKAKRAMRVCNVEWRAEDARRLATDAAVYAAFFGMRGKVPAFPEADFAAALERARAIESPDPVRDAKRFKAREARERARTARLDKLRAQVIADNAADAEAWRAGTASRLNPGMAYYRLSRADRRALGYHPFPVMLRVNGDEIETSKGARIPLDHAPRIWRLIESVRAAGREYVSNGHSERAGQFKIDRIDADGTLHAGCHVIEYAELARMAATLNLAGGAA